ARDGSAKSVVLDAIAKRLADRAPEPKNTDWDPADVARRVVREPVKISAAAQRRRTFTSRADALLLHPILGPFLFLGLMAAVFAAVFLVADPVTSVLDAAIGFGRTRLVHW